MKIMNYLVHTALPPSLKYYLLFMCLFRYVFLIAVCCVKLKMLMDVCYELERMYKEIVYIGSHNCLYRNREKQRNVEHNRK
jgi:hypothetical protein